ncbi:efflux transporter outer membrane subunit [Rhodanobacter geophilus]|uniref:Efflux transporter outer membrane subunit n=1 Tax=Rhodanobacter geophilus TaxID=3162488 RepID=A0ABV3QLF8_9GAMM
MQTKTINRTLRRASRLHRTWIVLMAAALSGCMAGPDYSRPEVALPGHYADAEALTGSPSQAGLDHWWKGFHDPVLDRIVDQTTWQNLDISAADARIAQARAMAQESRADLYPQGSLDGSVVRQRQSLLSPEGRLANRLPGYTRDQTLRQIDAGASWETDLAGGLHRRARAYRDEAQAAEAARLGVRISVVAEAADAYFRIREVQASQALLEAQVDADRRLAQLTVTQVAAGVATDRDEGDAQAVLGTDQAELAGLRDQLQRQGYRLDVLVGDAPGTDRFQLRASIDTAWTVPGIPPDMRPAELMRRRPDVIAAERWLAAKTEGIGAAMSQYYPSLSLGGLLGFERLGTGGLFESAAFQPALLAGIHWRLFDFGKVDAEVAAARGGRAEALSDYRQTVLRAAEDVEDALSGLAKLDAQERRWQQVVDADARSRASIGHSFDAGASSMIDVLQRERTLLIAKRMRATLRSDRARATVEVFRALGGGWSPGHEPSLAARDAP